MSFTFLDIVILISLVVFIVTRFLGEGLPKDDELNKKKKSNNKSNNKVIDITAKNKTTSAVRKAKNFTDETDGLEKIKSVDSSFNEKDFKEGAKQAYFMFYEALSLVNEDDLDFLTSPRIFNELMEESDDYESLGQIRKVVVDSVDSIDIVDAKLHGKTAIIDVKYIAQQKDFIEDSQGQFVSGDKDFKTVTFIWTWARPVNSDDLNWELDDMKPVS